MRMAPSTKIKSDLFRSLGHRLIPGPKEKRDAVMDSPTRVYSCGEDMTECRADKNDECPPHSHMKNEEQDYIRMWSRTPQKLKNGSQPLSLTGSLCIHTYSHFCFSLSICSFVLFTKEKKKAFSWKLLFLAPHDLTFHVTLTPANANAGAHNMAVLLSSPVPCLSLYSWF